MILLKSHTVALTLKFILYCIHVFISSLSLQYIISSNNFLNMLYLFIVIFVITCFTVSYNGNMLSKLKISLSTSYKHSFQVFLLYLPLFLSSQH